MECYSRYAIYFAPEQGSDLANFGASWLGWDAQNGQPAAHPIFDDLPVPVSELTATPRKYGFHGTLMAPFRLGYNKSVVDLNRAVAELAYRQFPFDIERIGLRSIGGFLAITPEERNADLVALAGACVRELDKFRAPLSSADLLRRRSANLTGPQDRYLTRWGYPYVFDEFQFHMTLSGKLAPDVIGPVQKRLQQALAKPLAQSLPVREICLFREDDDGRFYILKRYALNALAAMQPENRPKILSEAQHSG
ncbi:MAG: DUF1045 domain-containing protein [Rhodobacteraceae bacterium]|nr:DUF1045 domain-containing protein [Paracoccaceae bacterium]